MKEWRFFRVVFGADLCLYIFTATLDDHWSKRKKIFPGTLEPLQGDKHERQFKTVQGRSKRNYEECRAAQRC